MPHCALLLARHESRELIYVDIELLANLVAMPRPLQGVLIKEVANQLIKGLFFQFLVNILPIQSVYQAELTPLHQLNTDLHQINFLIQGMFVDQIDSQMDTVVVV